MADKVIEIRVTGTPPKLSYDWPILHVSPNDRVQWICKSHDYAIQFTNRYSPFDPQVISLSKAAEQPTEWCKVRGRKGVPDYCKYSVAVHIPGNNPPILTDDPIIIVDDE